ncbi:13054_t:CDS:2, partial [Dentiscutata heterogama]
MTSEQKYPGYEKLTSYLKRDKKSFWGFLHRCRDTIVTTASATSRWHDLDTSWCDRFLAEAKELLNSNDFNNLKIQVSEDRKRYNFEDYWNDVVNECKIRRDISERKVEKERILHDLSKINDEIKMKEDELTRILNKHPKDSSNLGDDLIAQSSSAIDENSTAMQSSIQRKAPKLPRQRNPRNKERINYNIESLSKKSVFGKAEKEKESAQEVVLYIALRANGEYNERRDVKIKKLEQKNAELEARLAVVEKSSVAVDGQSQNDKEAILEKFPEVFADDDSVVHVLEDSILHEASFAISSNIHTHSKSTNYNDYISEEPDKIEPTNRQYIEQGLIKELLSSAPIVSPVSSEIKEYRTFQITTQSL